MAKKKAAKKQTKRNQQKSWMDWCSPLVMALLSLGVSYGLVLWAIERGQLIGYILSAVAFYYSIHYLKEAAKKYFAK